MSHITNRQSPRTFTLSPGVETDVLFDAEGMDVTHAGKVVILVSAGTAVVDSIRRYRTPLDTEAADPLNYGPVPSGTKKRLEWDDARGSGLRLTLTSTAGGTATVEAVAFS